MENYSYNSSYPESGDSSPRSREIDFENPPPWEDSQTTLPSNFKVKFMCSYGGKIHPRPHDNQLSYVGGETKILALDRNVKFTSLLSKLTALTDYDSVSLKYQLPGEDLDALISVTNDDDLEHMMHEYDRLYRASPKPARLRIFIFSGQSQSQSPSLSSSTRSLGSDEVKSEKERFVEALNSAPVMTAPQPPSASAAVMPQLPPAAKNVDFLFGLEKAEGIVTPPPVQQPMGGRVQEFEDPVVPGMDERLIGSDPIQKHIQELQRMRIEEQQGLYSRKSDENLSSGYTAGEYYKVQEKISPVVVPGGVPYWTEKQTPEGYFPTNTVNNEQPVYMIPAPSTAYHTPMARSVTGQLPPNQAYYTVQRMPSEVYRDQQQMYNVNPGTALPPNLPPQKVAGYAEGFAVRPATTAGVGMVMEAGGYAPLTYDRGMGRQVIYTSPGGIMGTPAPGQAAQYQAMATGINTEMRQAGHINPEAGVKVVAKTTQGSL